MAQITINLNSPLNQSCQIGDDVYYVNIGSSGGFDISSSGIIKIGDIISITEIISDSGETLIALLCNIDETTEPPVPTDFIFFAKDRRVNEASLLGYYGDFKFENNSKQKAELFMAGCEVTPNS
jgi:hypothetical protein